MESIVFHPEMPAAQIASGDSLSIRLPETPKRYYRHGWQSWSLTAWTDTAQHVPIQKPHRLHPMQHDALHARRAGHHGSWVGAVEVQAGKILLLGGLSLGAHVALDGDKLTGQYEAGSGDWLIAYGDERSVFASYAEELGNRFAVSPPRPAPRVWCSWYSLYTAIDEQQLAHIFDGLGDLPFDVLQVDDGWQVSVGDWQANAKFSAGMPALAERIRATRRTPGLWLAPLIAVRSSRLYREHPDWFLRDQRGRHVSAGFNWGEDLFALDSTHPEVGQWLAALVKQVRAWGFDYLKLDFLYGGALPGKRYVDMPREAAYRDTLSLIRDAMGQDAFFMACAAPIIPSLGLCDALRVGPDVAAHWENMIDALLLHNPSIPGTRNAIRTTLHRLWLKPLVHPDPDVTYFRSVDCSLTADQKYLLQCLALICGFRASSDPPQWLTDDERLALQGFLSRQPHIEQVGARDFRIDGRELDYSSAMGLAKTPAGLRALQSAVVGWASNQRWVLRIDHAVGRMALKRKLRRMKGTRRG